MSDQEVTRHFFVYYFSNLLINKMRGSKSEKPI